MPRSLEGFLVTTPIQVLTRMGGIGTGGGGKTSLGVTEMRPETLVEMNRGRLRGWIFVGGAVLVLLAALSWPDLVLVAISACAAVAMFAVGVWVSRAIPDEESSG